MKYIVSVKIDGRIDVEVDTDSFEEAKWLAEMEVGDYDWNRIETILKLELDMLKIGMARENILCLKINGQMKMSGD